MIQANKGRITVPFNERIIGHFGDNKTETVLFEINETFNSDFQAELLIEFSDGNINSVTLKRDTSSNNLFIWNVMAEDIFCSGLAHIQLKISIQGGEVWHSPKAAVEFLHSIDEYNNAAIIHPNIITQITEKIEEIYELINNFVTRDDLNNYVTHDEATEMVKNFITQDETENLLKNYITRSEAEILVEESINDLLLPLDRRLDGI